MRRETRLMLIPFLFVWLWSTGFVGARLAVPFMDPLLLLVIRFVLVIPIFIGLMFWFRADRVARRAIPLQVLIGMLLHGFYLGGVFVAVRFGTPGGIAAIFVGLQPILATLLSRMFFGVAVSRQQALGLVLGFIGLVAVIAGSAELKADDVGPLGILACSVALWAITIATLLQKYYAQDVPLLGGSIWQYFGGLIVVTLGSWLLETGEVQNVWQVWVAVGWLVIALSVIAVLLLLYMIREGALAKVSAYMYLVPPVAAFQTWVLFGEVLSVTSLIGCAVVVLGVVLVLRD